MAEWFKSEKLEGVGCGCAIAVACMVGFAVLVVILFIFIVVAGAKASTDETMETAQAAKYGETRPECERPLVKKWMCGEGGKNDPQVVYVPLCGVIAPSCATTSLLEVQESDFASALRSIRAATRDTKIRGLCLMLDTPGGTVTESDILYDAVLRFKTSRKDRFVMVLMGSMCCSGGYYVAAGADFIQAHPTTVTGSIGVILGGFNAAELARKIGVRSVVIASGDNKALLDPLEPVNPKHVAILKRPVEQDYERFVSIVAKGRKLPVETVRPLADGRVLSAQDALDAKLIDGIGYAEDAWRKAAELAKAKKVRIYRYEEPFDWRRLFSASMFMKCGRAFFDGIRESAESDLPQAEYRLK